MNFIRILITISLALISGCTSIHIYQEENVQVVQGFGVLNISLSEQKSTTMLDIKGIGVTQVGSNVTIGYTEQKIASVNEACHIIFWIENESQVRYVLKLLNEVEGSCIINSKGL